MAAESKHDFEQTSGIRAQGGPAGPLTLALQGNLNARALREVGCRIKDARRNGRQVALDLAEVTLMDRAAMRFLLGQLRQGAELTNCPAYIKHWISQETHEPQT